MNAPAPKWSSARHPTPPASPVLAPAPPPAPILPPEPSIAPQDATIGQIGQAVGMFLLTSQYSDPNQLADVIHRLMLGEKIRVTACGQAVFVWRDREFNNWWLRR